MKSISLSFCAFQFDVVELLIHVDIYILKCASFNPYWSCLYMRNLMYAVSLLPCTRNNRELFEVASNSAI